MDEAIKLRGTNISYKTVGLERRNFDFLRDQKYFAIVCGCDGSETRKLIVKLTEFFKLCVCMSWPFRQRG
jgi:hypothetical protein